MYADCHVHLDAAPESLGELNRMHRRIGIERTVIVQRFTAGTDTTVLETALAEHPAATRGVTVIDDGVSDRQLERLHAAGVRGIRLNVGITHLPGSIGVPEFERTCVRVAPLGWHVKVLVSPDRLTEFMPALRRATVTMVLDHAGLLDPAGGVEQPAFGLFAELLRMENWWLLLAAADRSSHETAPWRDMLPILRGLAAVAPDRTIWGTDWPHSHHPEPLPQAEALVALLHEAVPDAHARRKILVDNPERLYQFG